MRFPYTCQGCCGPDSKAHICEGDCPCRLCNPRPILRAELVASGNEANVYDFAGGRGPPPLRA